MGCTSSKVVDFFFGEFREHDGGVSLDLRETIQRGEEVGGVFFTRQLNRLLREKNRMTLFDSTDIAPLDQLLDLISSEHGVGKVFIYAPQRSSLEPSAFPYLNVDLMMEEGVITVAGAWNASTEPAARAIGDCILLGLHRNKMLDKTWIVRSDASEKRLAPGGCLGDDAAKEVSELTGFPRSAKWILPKA